MKKKITKRKPSKQRNPIAKELILCSAFSKKVLQNKKKPNTKKIRQQKVIQNED